VEPVIREALRRLPERLPDGTGVVGGYWTRTNNPEIDLVGADRGPVAREISMVGSINRQHGCRASVKGASAVHTHQG
jgi:uncharacterized protein